MKKGLVISLFIAVVLILIKFYTSNYTIKYTVDNYDVLTNYKDKRLYFEIKNKNELYNFDIYMKRKLSKVKIDSIKVISDETFKCVYPSIKSIETYPLCYENGIYIDYNLIDSDLLLEYKKEIVNVEKNNKDFQYHNILNKNEYVALWNYNGYIVMNGSSYKNVEIFKKDKYDNSLSYLLGDKIYIANYDEEHEYSKLITLSLKTLEIDEIELGYDIDYDSYIVGNIEKKIYIFDNKHGILYEINTRKNETKIISNNELGYKKYNGEKFVNCSKSEYKVNKIKYIYNDSKYEYKHNKGLYKIIKENTNISQLINKENINIAKEYNNKIYYSNKDIFYVYEPSIGNTEIFYNYELSFNNNNSIFVYLDN